MEGPSGPSERADKDQYIGGRYLLVLLILLIEGILRYADSVSQTSTLCLQA